MTNRIAEIRRERGVSAARLASTIRVDKVLLYRLERGEVQLTQARMEQIARVLDCAPSDLLPSDNPSPIRGRLSSTTPPRLHGAAVHVLSTDPLIGALQMDTDDGELQLVINEGLAEELRDLMVELLSQKK